MGGYAIGTLLVVVVLALMVGVFLRAEHQVARSALIARPPAELWKYLVDLDAQVTWRPGLRTIEHLEPIDGKPSYRESGAQGEVRFVVDEERAPTDDAPGRRVTHIADDDLPIAGRWIVTLTAATPDTTRVTVTEHGALKNPVFRTLSRIGLMSLTTTIDMWLRALARHAGDGVVPIEPATPEA